MSGGGLTLVGNPATALLGLIAELESVNGGQNRKMVSLWKSVTPESSSVGGFFASALSLVEEVTAGAQSDGPGVVRGWANYAETLQLAMIASWAEPWAAFETTGKLTDVKSQLHVLSDLLGRQAWRGVELHNPEHIRLRLVEIIAELHADRGLDDPIRQQVLDHLEEAVNALRHPGASTSRGFRVAMEGIIGFFIKDHEATRKVGRSTAGIAIMGLLAAWTLAASPLTKPLLDKAFDRQIKPDAAVEANIICTTTLELPADTGGASDPVPPAP